jgi:hypothetical protein
VKTLLNAVGGIVILGALLLLPTLGYGVPGFKGFAVAMLGWAIWWWLVRLIYRTGRPKDGSPSHDGKSLS